MTNTPPRLLSYGRASYWRRNRRRIFVGLMTALIASVVAILLVPSGLARWTTWQVRRAALLPPPPATRVLLVQHDDSRNPATTRHTQLYYPPHLHSEWNTPSQWRTLFHDYNICLLFAGLLRDPSGQQRWVFVSYGGAGFTGPADPTKYDCMFRAWSSTCDPYGGPFRHAHVPDGAVSCRFSAARIDVDAGAPDPSDASAVIVPFVEDGLWGSIRCHLNRDGSVTMNIVRNLSTRPATSR